MQNHVKSAELAERLSIEEAARLVVKKTGKSLDYTISFLTDCAKEGHFSADIVASSYYANVSHISKVDVSKSTIATTELIEWLDEEIESAHQKAREAIAAEETKRWGYEVRPEDVRVTLAPESERLDALLADDSICTTTRAWVEYLSLEFAQAQGWEGAERDAKSAVVRAEYLNLFFALADTLPLLQEVSGIPWRGDQLPSEWLTSLHLRKSDLRDWARTHAPVIATSRIFAEPNAATADAGLAGQVIGGTRPRKSVVTVAMGNGGNQAHRLIIGPNNKASLDAFIETRSREIWAADKSLTKREIANAIATELKSKGHKRERPTDDVPYLSAATIEKAIPARLTGGRANNGRKKR